MTRLIRSTTFLPCVARAEFDRSERVTSDEAAICMQMRELQLPRASCRRAEYSTAKRSDVLRRDPFFSLHTSISPWPEVVGSKPRVAVVPCGLSSSSEKARQITNQISYADYFSTGADTRVYRQKQHQHPVIRSHICRTWAPHCFRLDHGPIERGPDSC